MSRFRQPKRVLIHFSDAFEDTALAKGVKRTHAYDRSRHSCLWNGTWREILHDQRGHYIQFYDKELKVTLEYGPPWRIVPGDHKAPPTRVRIFFDNDKNHVDFADEVKQTRIDDPTRFSCKRNGMWREIKFDTKGAPYITFHGEPLPVKLFYD